MGWVLLSQSVLHAESSQVGFRNWGVPMVRQWLILERTTWCKGWVWRMSTESCMVERWGRGPMCNGLKVGSVLSGGREMGSVVGAVLVVRVGTPRFYIRWWPAAWSVSCKVV